MQTWFYSMKTWPEFPPPGTGNKPLPEKRMQSAAVADGNHPSLCQECEREFVRYARRVGWTLVPYKFQQAFCSWCERRRATRRVLTILPALYIPPTEFINCREWKWDGSVAACNYAPCSMALDEFLGRARGLVGVRIVLDHTACQRYGQVEIGQYSTTLLNMEGSKDMTLRCFHGVDFVMRDAIVFTRAPDEVAASILRGVAGPVPVVMPHIQGDEAALLGPGVVVLDSVLCLLDTPKRVTVDHMRAARVVVFHQDVAQALCGPLKRMLDLTAVLWAEGVYLVRASTALVTPLTRSLKRFRVPLFWTVMHPDMWPLLRPLASDAHYLDGKRRLPVWNWQGPCQWLRHVANHCD
jgi:hypothetical protein